MKRFAFIDVPNTTGTTKNCLNFAVDWNKMFELLIDEKWGCKEVFYYKGHKGDMERKQLEKLKNIGYTIRTKLTHIHKNKVNNVSVICEKCNSVFIHHQNIQGNQKSNCDVELTVDALNTLSVGDEALFFTGDGDFAYLIEFLIHKGIFVWMISSQKRDNNGNIRFSTRLKDIIKSEGQASKRIKFVDIGSWKSVIEKVN